MAKYKYRVRPGFTYGVDSQYKPGDIVELDEETAKHVMDKLELAEVVVPGSAAVTETEGDETDTTPESSPQLFTSVAEEEEKPKRPTRKKTSEEG